MCELMLIVKPSEEMPRPKKVIEIESAIGGVREKVKVMSITDIWWGKNGNVVVCFKYKKVK